MNKEITGLTLPLLLRQSAGRYAERPALSLIGEKALSYQELAESVESLSHWLAEQGIGFGDKVAILGENCPHWGIAYFAICSMGAVAVPILTDFHPDAIAHIIRHSDAKAVFVSERLFPKIESPEFQPDLLFIHLETFTRIKQNFGKDRLRELKLAGLREFRKWKEKALRFAARTPVEPDENSLAVIVYTSGTSGHAKGVMLSHKNIVSNATAVRQLIPLFPDDRMLSVLPLAHTFECSIGLITPLSMGLHIFYLDKPPSGRVLLPALAQVRPTVMLTVPLIMEKIYKNNVLAKLTSNKWLSALYTVKPVRKMMHRLAGAKLKKLFGGKLRVMAIGGAPLPQSTEIFLREARFPFTIGYGLTECSPLLTASVPEKSRLGSAGHAVGSVTLRISEPSPGSGEGEIEAQGPNLMLGYHKDDASTAAVFNGDWIRTGDLGCLDQDGFIYIKGRSKNMLLGPSGENIYPEEIESLLCSLPLVQEALVYQQNGRLVAKAHLNGAELDELFKGYNPQEMQKKRNEMLEQIRRGVNEKVSAFAKLHQIYEQVEPFEKTPTHKIKRYLYLETP